AELRQVRLASGAAQTAERCVLPSRSVQAVEASIATGCWRIVIVQVLTTGKIGCGCRLTPLGRGWALCSAGVAVPEVLGRRLAATAGDGDTRQRQHPLK